MNQFPCNERAGFWIRLCAGLIDFGLTATVVVLAASVWALLGRYIPIDATTIVVYAVYSAVGLAVAGHTLGSWLCGIRIVRNNGNPVGLLRAGFRAFVVGLFNAYWPCLCSSQPSEGISAAGRTSGPERSCR